MVKGRSTKVIGVRVPDSVYTRIKALAEKKGLTVSEWCKSNLARAAGLLPDGSTRSHHNKR
jgi:predicted DNA-binding protein